MPRMIVTDAGVAAANAANANGLTISITKYRVGNATFTPAETDTSLQGEILSSNVGADNVAYVGANSSQNFGAISNIASSDDDSVEFLITLLEGQGDYDVGSIGLYLDNGTLFAVGSFDSIIRKVRESGSQLGNRISIRAVITLDNVAPIIEYNVIDFGVPTLPRVESLPVPSDSQADDNLYVTNRVLTASGSSLAWKRKQSLLKLSVSNAVGGGTFTLTYGSSTTSAIAYNAMPTAIKSALEGISGISKVNVSGSGSVVNPWLIFFEIPITVTSVTGSDANLTGGTAGSRINSSLSVVTKWALSSHPNVTINSVVSVSSGKSLTAVEVSSRLKIDESKADLLIIQVLTGASKGKLREIINLSGNRLITRENLPTPLVAGDVFEVLYPHPSHDDLYDIAENTHVDHSTVSITGNASKGISGGGDLTADRELGLNFRNVSDLTYPIYPGLPISAAQNTWKQTRLVVDQGNGAISSKSIFDIWRLLIPTGVVLPFGGHTNTNPLFPPHGFLICDGQTYSQSDYPELFAVIGRNFTSSTVNSTLFSVPNMYARSPKGPGTTPGYFRSGGWGRIEGRNIGITGGSNSVRLTENNLPRHRHSFTTDSAGNHAHEVPNLHGEQAATRNAEGDATGDSNDNTPISTTFAGAHTHTGNTDYTGAITPQSVDIRDPYIVFNWIIKI